MRLAYVDTSVLVAVLFGERGAKAMRSMLAKLDAAYSSNLLEAELRSVASREDVAAGSLGPALGSVVWVCPSRSLGPELARALEAGYLRGADLWHVGCALYLSQELGEIAFLTLDRQQRAVAGALGMATSVA